ncbi:hypothetical protein THAOC_28190 [Thalassiosira oceanica]|uniref:Uncharacterized protein n=1 Tax=Thalassiosira oceanica TaxID=159749 RepID=K0RJS4_THAOC|nr:hypothetical protein THAOC_28190 [Thalassiosira oceanica]|eukprot:EJK52519.1 hypothetical protein THAOC_28190 [Thalassiosira oceanica]
MLPSNFRGAGKHIHRPSQPPPGYIVTTQRCPKQLNSGERTSAPFVVGRPANPLKCRGFIAQSDNRPGGAPICDGSRRVLIFIHPRLG